MRHVDVLIVGQGLAGSALAWRLADRGATLMVVDRGGVDDQGRPSASRVAAGLITPITGKRLTLADGWAQKRDEAEAFYRHVEQQTGARFFNAHPSLRLFASTQEQTLVEQHRRDPLYAHQVKPISEAPLPPGLLAEGGGFWMPHAARLDTPRFLQATREWLTRRDAFREAQIAPTIDLKTGPAGIACDPVGVSARRVVFCQGYTKTTPAPEMRNTILPVHGDLLRIAAPQFEARCVVHQGVWAAPDCNRTEHLIGSTYNRQRDDAEPCPAGREQLLSSLRAFVAGPIDVVQHTAAVRPTTADRQPIARVSPSEPRIAWFNGLGAKGALLAPRHATLLANQLV